MPYVDPGQPGNPDDPADPDARTTDAVQLTCTNGKASASFASDKQWAVKGSHTTGNSAYDAANSWAYAHVAPQDEWYSG